MPVLRVKTSLLIRVPYGFSSEGGLKLACSPAGAPAHHLARPTNSSWVPPFGSSGDGKILVRRESNEMTGLYDMKRYENLLNW